MECIKRLFKDTFASPRSLKTSKRVGQWLLLGQFIIPAFASAHIVLSSDGATPPRNNNGVSCGAPGNSPAVFAPGSRISVDYVVQVKHGDTIRIDFAEANDQGFDNHLLAEFAAHYGAGQKNVTLPNVECDACTLRIQESGYTSCADIRLKSPDPMTMDTTPPGPLTALNSTAMGDAVNLSWQNPEADFAESLWLVSYSAIDVMPEAGHLYAEGEMLGDAKVVYVGDAAAHMVDDLMANSWVYFAAFARDEAGNYSEASKVSVMTGDALPEPLSLNVAVMQNNTLLTQTDGTIWLDTSAGDVLVQAQASRPEDSTITWQVSDMQLINIATAADEYIFDAAMLGAGEYTLMVDVQAGEEWVQQSVKFAVAAEASSSANATSGSEPTQSKSGGAGGWLWLVAALGLIQARRKMY